MKALKYRLPVPGELHVFFPPSESYWPLWATSRIDDKCSIGRLLKADTLLVVGMVSVDDIDVHFQMRRTFLLVLSSSGLLGWLEAEAFSISDNWVQL